MQNLGTCLAQVTPKSVYVTYNALCSLQTELCVLQKIVDDFIDSVFLQNASLRCLSNTAKNLEGTILHTINHNIDIILNTKSSLCAVEFTDKFLQDLRQLQQTSLATCEKVINAIKRNDREQVIALFKNLKLKIAKERQYLRGVEQQHKGRL